MLKCTAALLILFVLISPNLVPAQTSEQGALARASALVKAGKPKQAATVLAAAAKAHPESEALHAAFGRLLFKQARYEDAVQELGLALQINPDSRENTMLLAESLIGWQHYGVAVDFLHAVQNKFGAFPEFHYDLGLAYYSLNQTKDAKPELEETLRLAPNLDRAQYLLAACIATEGDYAKAVEIFRKLVKDHPQNATYWATYAQMLMRVGNDRIPEALKACRRARALKPRDLHVQYVTATILLQSGNFAEARPLFERLAAVSPKELTTHVALVRIYSQLGERELAKKQIEIVHQLEKEGTPKDASAPPPPAEPNEQPN
jgi:predicted Zn-dependent protease